MPPAFYARARKPTNTDYSFGKTNRTGRDPLLVSSSRFATYLLLGPLGLFAHNFVRGKNVTIPTDRVFDVFVDHDVHVNSNQPFGADAGFDK